MNIPKSKSSFQEQCDEFFKKAKYIKKWPKYDELLKRSWLHSYVMVTGSSWSWKTTQVTNINEMEESFVSWWRNLFWDNPANVISATRYITRQWRNSDNNTGFVENIHIESKEEFMRLVKEGKITIYWTRDLWSETVYYWFESNLSIKNKAIQARITAKSIAGQDYPSGIYMPDQWWIVIYSGNNDMERNFDGIKFCKDNEDRFVHIHVEANNNVNRFIQRSTDVADTDKLQLAKRASDDGKDVYDMSHIVINNADGKQEAIQKEIQELMNLFVAHNTTVKEDNTKSALMKIL